MKFTQTDEALAAPDEVPAVAKPVEAEATHKSDGGGDTGGGTVQQEQCVEGNKAPCMSASSPAGGVQSVRSEASASATVADEETQQKGSSDSTDLASTPQVIGKNPCI